MAISVLIILALLFSACTEVQEIKDIHVSEINILSEGDIVLSKGGTASVEFSIYPTDAYFNYVISSAEFQLRLVYSPGTLNAGERPQSFYLSDVTCLSPHDGIYAAMITDLDLGLKYEDKVVLEVLVPDDDGPDTIVRSQPFIVRNDDVPYFTTVSFLKEHNPTALYKDFEVDVSDGSAELVSPLVSSPLLVASFDCGDAEVYVDGVKQVSGKTANDFSKPVRFDVKGVSEYSFTISVMHSGLPVVFIDTPYKQQVPSKWENWLAGTSIKIYNPDWTVDYEGQTGIRGRGNTTWSYPKKPYALKFDEKAEVLGMPKHKRWVLLANWMDRTIMRNAVSFKISSMTELEYTPRGQFVELYLNGIHRGNYFLCEHIKVDKNRVPIDELDEDEIDGGYMMELDVYYDEVYKFKSQVKELPYMFKDPDEVNDAQFSFMQNFINNLEKSLYDDESFEAGLYKEYLDVNSFIDWWLVMELTGNGEPNHPKSCYMYKDKGGKLKMGPVWDFDWGTFIRMDFFTIQHSLYYTRLLQDRTVVELAKQRWKMYVDEFRKIPDYIRTEAERIRNSEHVNHEMWPITQIVNKDEKMSFDDAIETMIDAYEGKLEWMDKTMAAL